jgi:hypothetical protein
MRHLKLAFLAVAALGLVLLVMMVIVEDEFGALPLALLLIGSVGYLYCWIRQRSSTRHH